MRYAIDPTKIHNELGWLPKQNSKMVSRRQSNGILKTKNGGKKSSQVNIRNTMQRCTEINSSAKENELCKSNLFDICTRHFA